MGRRNPFQSLFGNLSHILYTRGKRVPHHPRWHSSSSSVSNEARRTASDLGLGWIDALQHLPTAMDLFPSSSHIPATLFLLRRRRLLLIPLPTSDTQHQEKRESYCGGGKRPPPFLPFLTPIFPSRFSSSLSARSSVSLLGRAYGKRDKLGSILRTYLVSPLPSISAAVLSGESGKRQKNREKATERNEGKKTTVFPPLGLRRRIKP